MNPQQRDGHLSVLPVLAISVRDLLAVAFGERGQLADITWARIDLAKQEMSLDGELYALNGTLRISFTLPHLPIPRSDDTDVSNPSSSIPF